MKRVEGQLTFSATDLGGHLACVHLSTLSRQVADGELDPPAIHDPLLDILAERGRVHELAYRDFLLALGKRVVDGPTDPSRLADLLREGPDVVYQAALQHGSWRGRADFLLRVDRPTENMPWSYEVADTKLSADTRAASILQLCVYSELLEHVQGIPPVSMHVVHPGPNFPTDTYRFIEFSAFARRLRASLEQQVETRPETYPEPVDHCSICEWRARCQDQRRSDDHPSLVAGLTRLHTRSFGAHGANTVALIAQQVTPLRWRPEHGALGTYEGLVQQARLQIAARSLPTPPWEVLPVEAGRGLMRLPEPTPSDVFLDFEGDPFIGTNGREFLFGCVTFDDGAPRYTRWWAYDDEAERRAYEELVDLITARVRSNPGTHVYHYAPYEPAALTRLRNRYPSRGEDLDVLLRGKRFVDLFAIVRQSARIGIESYGLKSVEPVIGFTRARPLSETGPFHRRVLLALQRGLADVIQQDWLDAVESYNRDDCLATVVLRNWLEARRTDRVQAGDNIDRPPLLDGRLENAPTITGALVARLLEQVPTELGLRDALQAARWTLAQLVEWYSREARVAYAESHRRSDLDDLERLEDPKSIAGLVLRQRLPGAARANSLPIDVYEFPPQEIQIASGDRLMTKHGVKFGEVVKIDVEAQRIEIKKTRASIDAHPASAYVWETVSAGTKEEALLNLARSVAESGFAREDERSLARDLLTRLCARGLPLTDISLRRDGEGLIECAQRLATQLDSTILPVQGPPGTGKTEIAARMMLHLVKAGKRIGVTATSHKVILNLIERVATIARRENMLLRVLVKTDDVGPTAIPTTTDPSEVERRIQRLHVVGATAWQWSRPGMANSIDVLFIDEAGQMSVTDGLAVVGATKNLVLVGDPMQLQQPIQASHPDGIATSCLAQVLGRESIVAADHGLFLDVSHRLHPSIARFTSEQFYRSQLQTSEDAAARTLPMLQGPGLYYLPVHHEGNQSRSREEAHAVVHLVSDLLRTTSPSGAPALGTSDVLIVAPYNAHVALLRDSLASANLAAVRIGTVDKFQGQEAAVSIYTMATSSPEDAPRGMDFLYDRHRLNVATSRARVVAILVASPRLLRPSCKTPEQLRLASAMSRFVELAHQLKPRSN